MNPSDVDRAELEILERADRQITDPARQTATTPEGQEYRRKLASSLADLRDRVEGREAYDDADPKHPDFHDRLADIWDGRDKAAGLRE